MLKRYIINSLSTIGGSILLALLMLIATPVLIKLLGETEYGLYRLAFNSLVAYVVFLDWGLAVSAKRFFGDAYNRTISRSPSEILGLLFKFYAVVVATAIFIVAGVAVALPTLVNCPPELIGDFRFAIVSAGMFGAVSLLISPFRGVLIVFARYDLNQLITIAMRFVLVGGGAFFVWYTGTRLPALSYMAITAAIVGLFAAVSLSKLTYPAMSIDWRYRDSPMVRRMAAFGFLSMASAIGPLVVYQTQDIFIAAYIEPAAVAIFATAAILMTQLRVMVNAVAAPLFPLASALRTGQDVVHLRELMYNCTRSALLVWVLLAIPMAVFAEDILSIWVGERFSTYKHLVWILLIGNLGTAWHFSSSHLLTARGEIRHLASSQLIMAIVAITWMTLNFTVFEGGLAGVAWAVSIPVFLRSGLWVPIYACRQMEIPPLDFLLDTGLRLIVTIVAALLVGYVLREWTFKSAYGRVALGAPAVAILTAVVGTCVMFPRHQRAQLLTRLTHYGSQQPSALS